MFDNFKDSQFVAYSLLCNAIDNNKLSHAYLIDGNNNQYAFDFVMAFVKKIICDDVELSESDKNNICLRIDEGNYTEVKIIETDSLIIKKEQLLDLQKDFSLSGVEGNRRIYIIKDCDKMNKQASNSILKFLEEPNDNIIAILFTNNINNILSTIISRCQKITLVKENNNLSNSSLINFANSFSINKNNFNSFINDESKKDLINNVIVFIKYFENNGLDTMISLKKLWYNSFSTRDDSMFAIYLIVNFYYDLLRYKYNLDGYFFEDYIDLIKIYSQNNTIDELLYKIDLTTSKYNDLKYNLNVNLLVDDMVIRMGECNEYC